MTISTIRRDSAKRDSAKRDSAKWDSLRPETLQLKDGGEFVSRGRGGANKPRIKLLVDLTPVCFSLRGAVRDC